MCIVLSDASIVFQAALVWSHGVESQGTRAMRGSEMNMRGRGGWTTSFPHIHAYKERPWNSSELFNLRSFRNKMSLARWTAKRTLTTSAVARSSTPFQHERFGVTMHHYLDGTMHHYLDGTKQLTWQNRGKRDYVTKQYLNSCRKITVMTQYAKWEIE